MNILQQKMQEKNIEIIKMVQFIVSPMPPKILRPALATHIFYFSRYVI